MTNILATPTPAGKPDGRSWSMPRLLPAFLPLLLLPYLARDTWSAGGSGNWLTDYLATPGSYVLAAAMLVLAALVSRRSRLRRFRGTMAWFGLLLLMATTAGAMLAESIRDDAINRLSRAAAPLVQAIGAYEARHGRVPETLDSLIPDFLARLPATGIPAAPAWQYQAFPVLSGVVPWWLSAQVGLIGEVAYHPESGCVPATCATGGKWRYWQW